MKNALKYFHFTVSIPFLMFCSLKTSSQITVYNNGISTTLSQGATVTIGGNYINQTNGTNGSIDNQSTIQLTGNWTNNAGNNVFPTSAGLTLFNGTALQSIGGTGPTNFFDLTLNNSSGAILTGAENLIGTMSLNNGIFNTNAQAFTMASTATATARIAQITGSGDITGNVIVQRYAPGGSTGWALVGSPIASALTLNDWDDDIYISCSTCPDGSAGGFTSIYTYSEAATGALDSPGSYVAMNTINDGISPGIGYWIYLGNASYTTTGITMDVTGAPRKFNYTIPLSYNNYGSTVNDGWNLISNPYPSQISWSALKGTTSNIDNAIYVYNADLNGGSGGFASYVNGISSPAVSSGGIGDEIPMWQAFYVHSTGATSLAALESNKISGNQAFLKSVQSTASNPTVVRLSLIGANGNDETVLYFEPNATDTFDYNYDSYKMPGQDPMAPALALEKDSAMFQINGVAPVSGTFTMALKALTGYNGSYTISAGDLSSFPNGGCITLIDKYTNTTTDLKSSDYVFNLSNTTASSRFILSITISSLATSAAVTQPTCKDVNLGQIIVGGSGAGPCDYIWKLNGAPFKVSLNKMHPDTLSSLNSGSYEVELHTTGTCDYAIETFSIYPQSPVVCLFSCPDTLELDKSSTITFSNNSINSVSSIWELEPKIYSTVESPIYSYNSPGIYKVKLTSTSSTGCSQTATNDITVIGKTTGVEKTDLQKQILVQTLSNNCFVISGTLESPAPCSMNIYDGLAKLIYQYKIPFTSEVKQSVNLDGFPKGIYYLEINTAASKKIIKLPVY